MERALYVRRCAPIALTLFGIGPFQEKPFHLDFTDQNGEASNFFLLISPNGRGKTALLESMASLMPLLDPNQKPGPPHERLWANPKARAQLDLRIVVSMEGAIQEILLTLAAGDGAPHETKSWEQSALERVQTKKHLHIVWSRSPGGHWARSKSADSVVDELHAFVGMEMKNVYETFGLDTITAPSLLYFDAYRNIPVVNTHQDPFVNRPPAWFYRPLHRFGLHGDQWEHSLDSLLVWLTWLGDGRYEQAQQMVNEFVFVGTGKRLEEIDKEHMYAPVVSGGRRHRLDQLSSGEKSLVQLILRIYLHVTSHSILVIDELDIHLHPKLQHRLYQALKKLVIENPTLTLIATTHSRELIDQFGIDMRVGTPELRFAGHLIDKEEIQ